VDIFEANYPFAATAHGLALCWPYAYDIAALKSARTVDGEGAAKRARKETGVATQLNLRDLRHAKDKTRLTEGSCVSHSRAYLHHLLRAEEITGEVLLETHNVHHYLSFIATIRRALAEGVFEVYHALMLRRLAGPGCA
jgi:queuine tRNA-ribosyltransferase subunit QTRTD1